MSSPGQSKWFLSRTQSGCGESVGICVDTNSLGFMAGEDGDADTVVVLLLDAVTRGVSALDIPGLIEEEAQKQGYRIP